MGFSYLTDERYARLLEDRARRPDLIREKAARRSRRPLLDEGGRLLLIAADHPARLALKVGSDAMAMADRRSLLERAVVALRQPGVDGLLATPDIIEDLLLLDELHDKILIGSMNRAGLAGATWELDDRFTAYDAERIARLGLEGGKMLLRLDLDDPGTLPTLQACADAVTALAERGLTALIEPLPVHRDPAGKVVVSDDPDELIGAISVASALGATSQHTWLKLPAPRDPARVLAATTLPSLLLGGDPGSDPDGLFAAWSATLALPQVRGLVAGRSLLYPGDGDVERAVTLAARMVHGGRS